MKTNLKLVDDHFHDDDVDDVPLDEPSDGFTALGFHRNAAVVFSDLQKCVVHLRPRDLSEVNLRMQLGTEWFDACSAFLESKDKLGGRRGSSTAMVGTYILASCQAAGKFRPSAERGAGAWLDEDGGLIVNGDTLWRHDGTVLLHGIRGNHVYPAAASLGYGPETAPASQGDVDRILAVFRSYNWSVPAGAEMVLGWIGSSLLATALRRRPHMLVTGSHGSGKSTLLEQVSRLLGKNAAQVTGRPTLIGLNQLVKEHPSRVIVIDEFEGEGQGIRRSDVFEAARASYSLQEGDSGVVRGSVTGDAISYRLSSPFLAGGISPAHLEPADQSRWVVLELKKLEKPSEAKSNLPSREELDALGPRLARLLVSRWPAFRQNLEVFRGAVLEVGGDHRMADTYSPLLAGFWTFKQEDVASGEEALELVERAQVRARVDSLEVRDEQECLNSLLTRVVTFPGGLGGSSKLSIGEACNQVAEDAPGKRQTEGRLAQLGLRVRHSRADGKWYLLVANSPNHSELRRLFAGTKWAHGNWSVVLRRLPGGHESTQRLGPGMPPAKVTAFQLPQQAD